VYSRTAYTVPRALVPGRHHCFGSFERFCMHADHHFFKQYVPLAYIVCLLDGDYWSGSWGHTTYRRLFVGAFFNSPIVSPELTVFAFFFKMGIEWVWINDQSSATRFQYRHEIKCEVRFASKVNLMDALLVFRRGKHLNWWVGRVGEIW
jgi:hypothetical protein